jgi:hypothetical protein
MLTRKLSKFLDGLGPKARAGRPDHPAPPTNGFESIPGVYHDAAYGDIELRFLGSATLDHDLRDQPAWSFVVNVDKAFVKEFFLEHFDRDVFNVTAKLIFPETGAVMWDMTGQGIQARFGEGGMGLQHIWGAAEGIPDGNMERNGIRNGSEVFFARV